MAEHQLARNEEAHAAFARALKWIADKKFVVATGDDGWRWYEQVGVTRLRREAEKLLGVQEKNESE
jgi:hypothetical protein